MSERIICNDNGGELREEIVRCRDCRYFYCLWIDACVCKRHGEKLMPWVEPDGFCAWGEHNG